MRECVIYFYVFNLVPPWFTHINDCNTVAAQSEQSLEERRQMKNPNAEVFTNELLFVLFLPFHAWPPPWPAGPPGELWRQCTGTWRTSGGPTRTDPTWTFSCVAPHRSDLQTVGTSHGHSPTESSQIHYLVHKQRKQICALKLICTHQLHRFVVHVDVLLRERNLFDFESDTGKTQLPCDVHPSQLHVHCNNLHGTNASDITPQRAAAHELRLQIMGFIWGKEYRQTGQEK